MAERLGPSSAVINKSHRLHLLFDKRLAALIENNNAAAGATLELSVLVSTVGSPSPAPADLHAAIHRLRRERNAVILAHYYQDGEIQDIADFVGDSLDLSRKAASSTADVILFCGVRFMGEVAKILAPSRTVLIPDAAAGCSLEDSCRPDVFSHFRNRHPDHIAVTYIN